MGQEQLRLITILLIETCSQLKTKELEQMRLLSCTYNNAHNKEDWVILHGLQFGFSAPTEDMPPQQKLCIPKLWQTVTSAADANKNIQTILPSFMVVDLKPHVSSAKGKNILESYKLYIWPMVE